MTPLAGVSLMVFFVLACQCMSTIVVVRRESGSWGWPVFMFGYMSILAYCASLAVYQAGSALGLGRLIAPSRAAGRVGGGEGPLHSTGAAHGFATRSRSRMTVPAFDRRAHGSHGSRSGMTGDPP